MGDALRELLARSKVPAALATLDMIRFHAMVTCAGVVVCEQ